MSPSADAFVLALDVGVSNVKAALVSREGNIHHIAISPTPLDAGPENLPMVLKRTLKRVLGQAHLVLKDVVAVGCAVPGVANPSTGEIVLSSFSAWDGIDTRETLEKTLERPVAIEGDGNAAALAAYTFGPSRGQEHLLTILIGTGISCGYVAHGKLLRGVGNAALAAGHIPLSHQGRACSCGRQGCWEAQAGGAALRTILKEYQKTGHTLPGLPEELADLAMAGGPIAAAIWEEQGTMHGMGVATLLTLFNPRTVILAGGVLKAWSLFNKSLLRTARKLASAPNGRTAIVCAPEPDRLPLIGAAIHATRTQVAADFFVTSKTEKEPR